MAAAKQKVLILSCTGGLGHIKAGTALYERAVQCYPNIDARHINVLEYLSPLLRRLIGGSYDFWLRLTPSLYHYLYTLDDSGRGTISTIAHSLVGAILKKPLQNLITDCLNFKPDRIITTHYLIPFLLKNRITAPIDVVITDYRAHQVWLHSNVRRYFVGSAETAAGIKNQNQPIIVSGIPISPDFIKKNTEPNSAELSRSDSPTILLLAGGSGLIDTTPYARNILENIKNARVIAVAGKNYEALFKKLTALSALYPNLSVHTYLDPIANWMKQADIIVTKPGGLTVTEAVFLKKPLVLIGPAPGQEAANVRFVLSHGYGQKAAAAKDLSRVITTELKKLPGQSRAEQLFPNDIILNAN